MCHNSNILGIVNVTRDKYTYSGSYDWHGHSSLFFCKFKANRPSAGIIGDCSLISTNKYLQQLSNRTPAGNYKTTTNTISTVCSGPSSIHAKCVTCANVWGIIFHNKWDFKVKGICLFLYSCFSQTYQKLYPIFNRPNNWV